MYAKVSQKNLVPLKKAFEDSLIDNTDFYREIHIDLLKHPVNTMRPDRKMLPAMCGLLMELVEIVKHCDAIDSSYEIGGIIELLSSTSPPDFPFWNDQMLNSIGKPSTPPSVGVFADKPNYDWVPEIYFYSLDILKQEYPEIRIIYHAMKREGEIKYNEDYMTFLRLMYIGPKK